MRLFCVLLVSFAIASPAAAGLTPGPAVENTGPIVLVADINGDGLDDLIGRRTARLNDGVSFAREISLNLPVRDGRNGHLGGESVIQLLDLNGDRILDIMTVDTPMPVPPSAGGSTMSYPETFRLYVSDAQRNLTQVPFDKPRLSTPMVGDVDRDGRDDIVLFERVDRDVWSDTTRVTVRRSLGDGTFESLAPFEMVKGVPHLPGARLQMADFDGDARADIFLRASDDLVVLRSLGGGRFEESSRYLPGSFGQTIDLGDVDGDGHADVVLTSAGMNDGVVTVVFGDGRGGFPRLQKKVVRDPSGSVAVGRFTRADRTEIAVGTWRDAPAKGDVVVLGYDGSLREVWRTPIATQVSWVKSGAFDASPLTDLLVSEHHFPWIPNEMLPHTLFRGASHVTAAATAVRRRSGPRRIAPAPAASEMVAHATWKGECIDASPETWKFRRDGVFASKLEGSNAIELVFDGQMVHYRLRSVHAKNTVNRFLLASDGVYTGEMALDTHSCGWRIVRLTLTFDAIPTMN